MMIYPKKARVSGPKSCDHEQQLENDLLGEEELCFTDIVSLVLHSTTEFSFFFQRVVFIEQCIATPTPSNTVDFILSVSEDFGRSRPNFK